MHIPLGRGMNNPCQKLFGITAKLIQFLSVLVVAGFLFAPKQAEAQLNMTTIGNALNGSAADIAALDAALGNPAAPYDVNAFLQGIRAAYGDLPAPAPSAAATQFLAAGGGSVPDMLAIQTALFAPAAIPGVVPQSGSGYFTQYFAYLDAYGVMQYPFGYPNAWDDLINVTIAGTGNMGLETLVAALGGSPGSIGTLGTVLYNGLSGNWNTFRLMVCGGLGTPPSCANAIALIQLAISGDAAAQGQLNTFFGALLLSNSTSGIFDAQAVAWITSLGSAGGGSANCLIDTDGDGIMDCIDPDIDGDGTPNNYDTDQNGDGVVDNPDTDGDGIPDTVDPTPGGGNPPPPPGNGGTGGTGSGGTGTSGGGSTPPTNDCDNSVSAPLTGGFGADPCPLAEDTLQMVDADYWDVAGEQFVDRLNKLWTDEMLPSLKNMTAQWHASVIDQTRQFGTTVDSHDLSKQVKAVQSREIEAKKRAMPNERSCVSATPGNAMTMTSSISTNIAHGFQQEAAERSGGAPGTPSEQGPVAVKNTKLQQYCDRFNNPDANAGANPCPAATTAVPGPWPDGDIDIEGILLKDTLIFDNAARAPNNTIEYEAAKAIMANLIEPEVQKRLTPDVETTQVGREYILRLEQIEAWRSIAHHVVGAMIARRVSIPLPKTAGGNAGPPPPPPPAQPPPAPGAPQGSRGNYDAFLRMLGQREAPDYRTCNQLGYCGQYQMGGPALADAGCIQDRSATWPNTNGQVRGTPDGSIQPNYQWLGGTATCPCGTSMAAFRADPACQKVAVTEFHRKKWLSIPACARNEVCKNTVSPPAKIGNFWLTPSGMLAGAHLMGGGGVRCFVCGGPCNPATLCDGIPCDGNVGDRRRTKITEYMERFAGYDIPFSALQCGPMAGGPVSGTPYASVGTGTPPPPPRPVGDTIREIRIRAGVDPKLIAENPSYNEIMLAMTKERFLDPDYYARMGNQVGALKQEQASVKAYIAMQMQDIYLLQEQINLLLAARAAMRLNESGQGTQDRAENMPVSP